MSYIIQHGILLGIEFLLAEKQTEWPEPLESYADLNLEKVQVIRLSPNTAYLIEGEIPTTSVGVDPDDRPAI